MPAYDGDQFKPPAPVARVVLRNSDTGAAVDAVPMLIDTGADVSLVPQSAADSLGVAADPSTLFEVSGFDGTRSLASIVRLEMIFCGRTFRGQFLLTDRPWGVPGRNIINRVPLLLDGPRLAWDEHR